MDEKKLNKLAEVLKKHGLSDDDIESVKLELSEESEVEEPEESPAEVEEPEASPEESPVGEGEVEPSKEEPEAEPVETSEPEGEPVGEEVVEEGKPEAEGEPAEPVEPVEPEGEPAPEEPQVPEEQGVELPEGVEEVDPTNPVVEPEVPGEPAQEQPQSDYSELVTRLEESEKARQGLEARIASLEEALRQSGIMDESTVPSTPIGVDDPTRVDDFRDDEAAFDSVLDRINRNRY